MLDIKEFKNRDKEENKESKNTDAKKLIEKMFEARQVAHNSHLKTKSYSEHKALGSFYEKILELADTFAETYQGQYGLVGDIKIVTSSSNDITSYLQAFSVLCKEARDSLKDGHLQNIVDEVLSLTYQTIYKLKYLK